LKVYIVFHHELFSIIGFGRKWQAIYVQASDIIWWKHAKERNRQLLLQRAQAACQKAAVFIERRQIYEGFKENWPFGMRKDVAAYNEERRRERKAAAGCSKAGQ
jgi:hypothetical protein